MKPKTGQQTVAIHKLTNISWSIGIRTIKFDQLIKYTMKNISLENHAQNVLEKLFPEPFPQK